MRDCIGRKRKDKMKNENKFNLKKNLLFVILLGILTIIVLSKPIIFKPKLNCTDGTFYESCSNNRPLYCSNGTIINNSRKCGCPYDFKKVGSSCEKIKRCEDNTIYLECSRIKPLYCFDGSLTNKASICGCPYELVEQGDSCISIYKLRPKNISLKYILKGKEDSIKFEVYGGLNDYLAKLSEEDYYDSSWKNFIMENLNEEKQQEQLWLLVEKIKSEATNLDDQARIAISIVQNIRYDEYAAKFDEVEFRYPYETLYDKIGVCGDKSILLAFLLRELGFGVVVFEYNTEEHRSIGIKCSDEYDYQNTGYCFIETTTPSIITDSEGEYNDYRMASYKGKYLTLKLSNPSEIIYISNGTSFDAMEEYFDLKKFKSIDKKIDVYGFVYEDSEDDMEIYKRRMERCFDQLDKNYQDLTSSNYDSYLRSYGECENIYDDYKEAYDDYFWAYEDYDDYYDDWWKIINKYGIITK